MGRDCDRGPSRSIYEQIYHRCGAQSVDQNGKTRDCNKRMIEGDTGIFYCPVHDADAIRGLPTRHVGKEKPAG